MKGIGEQLDALDAESMLNPARQFEVLIPEKRHADANNFGIQQCSSLLSNLLEYDIEPYCWPVGPMGGHRFHHVRHCQDFRFGESRICFQARG